MSVIDTAADTEEELRAQLEKISDAHEKSAQAHGEPSSDRHNDGEHLHKHFGVQPLHKYLAKADRDNAAVAAFPQAFVDPMVYTTDRDLELVRQLVGEVDYDFRDPEPSHEALERYPPLRAKLLEWIADDPDRANQIRSVKGTDIWAHGEPGGGKTTLFLSIAMWRMQVNNSTVLWAESLDDSGTNERTEWLPFAPFATIAAPSGLDPVARIVPTDSTVDSFEVELEDIARDVIYYDSVQDLMSRLQPGQFYVVYPDPLHRGCEAVSRHNYFDYTETTARGEEGPDSPTPADHWWFAFIAHRISGDVFIHPTFLNIDETGNLLDPDASKNIHQHYQKIQWFARKYADARKKGLSFGYQTHAIGEVHPDNRAKIRWRLTMNGTSPPSSLAGQKECPLNNDITSDMNPGEGVIWKSPNFATVKWPNLKRSARLDAEVSIDFKQWQDAVGGGAA